MNTATRPMYEWQDLPWKKIEQAVFKLQKHIYQASQRKQLEALMTAANHARSRVRVTSHVRF